MVRAAAADAANNLIPCSVEAVGQVPFSTAMVQQPVPALQNSFLLKLRWLPRLALEPPSGTERNRSPFESLYFTLTSWQQLALHAF